MVCEGKEESMITGSRLLHFKQRKQISFGFMCEIYKKNLNQRLGTIRLLINTLCQEDNLIVPYGMHK